MGVHNNRSATTNAGVISLNFNDFENNINVSFPVNEAGTGILSIPGLDKTNKFVFIIPGYTHGITTHSMGLIEESFKSMDTYVIILHDSVYTNLFKTKNVATNYEKAVTYANGIGKSLADVLVILTSNGVSVKDIHFIGHSMGGHIAGVTGQSLLEKTGLKLSRISALDPSGPCYEDRSNHVKRGQATFVDIYHCNAFELASSRHYGDVSIFVNNGVIQPKCFSPTSTGTSPGAAAALCSHMSCENFFFSTLAQPDIFPAFKCDSYRSYKRGECKNNEQISAGYWMPTNASGNYYTTTGDNDIYQP
ncbi:lipase member H-like [Aricia agestis]|uniref:lipase member H-like n=1 Tax=Aricia agestis TaxID=91739 RepID=UPI001C202CBC|nr:lipase member H-like [Aricia agestis]